jgi:ElaB/YqjD/DUF883 family membrane-anchored ribosome-binding protein
MEKQVISTSETPSIKLEVHGDLRLKGFNGLEVIARSVSSNDLVLEKSGDDISIICQSDCTVRVPRASIFNLDACHGNASIKDLDGSLTVRDVHGNLFLHNVASAHIERVRGDLSARHVDGDFNLQVVEGNANVRDVQGDFIVTGGIQGNLSFDEVEGCAAAHADGNISLRLDPLSGQSYEFTAGGNILCRLSEDVSAVVKINKAARMRLKFADVRVSEQDKFPYQHTLGDGGASLTFTADGNVDLVGQGPDWEIPEDFYAGFAGDFKGMVQDFGEQMENQVSAQMEMIENQLNTQLENLTQTFSSTGLPADQAQRMREAGDRAAARAREKMQRTQEKIRRKIENAQRRAEQRARSSEKCSQPREKRAARFEWSTPKPEPGNEPVTDEERLMILKMLEQKKITTEEADQLLAALEGNHDVE